MPKILAKEMCSSTKPWNTSLNLASSCVPFRQKGLAGSVVDTSCLVSDYIRRKPMSSEIMATRSVSSISIVDGVLQIAIKFGINETLSAVHTNLFATAGIVSVSKIITATTVEVETRGFIFTSLRTPKSGRHTVETVLYNREEVEVTTLMKVKTTFTVADFTVSSVCSKVLLGSSIR